MTTWEAGTLANVILTQNSSLDTLQTDEWLDEMEKMEREGGEEDEAAKY